MHPSQIVIRSREFDPELRSELAHHHVTIFNETETTFWLKEDRYEAAWADCVWRNVKTLPFESIKDANRKLWAISKQWDYLGDLFHRRGVLISEGLTRKMSPEFVFPTGEKLPRKPAFTLADPNLILYSENVQRPTADGKIPFLENRDVPPSRAYLKLWEALTILNEWPQSNERVVDLGSSPGSWTWALSELNCRVLSLDRAELTPAVMRATNIEFRKADAFQFKPVLMDWVFSDVICFPEKLYQYVMTWIESGLCEKFVCNVKFAGEVDPEIVDRFRQIPHSRIIHLRNGKKEVTWIRHPKL